MADRPIHPSKEIEAAVAHAEARGWTWFKIKGPAWGKLLCPHHDRDGCTVFVWLTPRSPENHARQMRREVDRCPHSDEGNNDERV